MNLARFFQITSIILVIFAAGLVAHGVHEFNEAGLIPPIIEHLWDINHILDEKSTLGELLKTLVGYNGNPSLSEVIAYLLYFVIISVAGFSFSVKNKKNLLYRRIFNEKIIGIGIDPFSSPCRLFGEITPGAGYQW